MQLEFTLTLPVSVSSFSRSANAEANRNKMAGYLLSGPRETVFAVIAQKLSRCLIRTANAEQAAIEMQNRQPLEPIPCVGWVEHFRTVEYNSEDTFNFLSRQTIPLAI